jgi:hypothetical protein
VRVTDAISVLGSFSAKVARASHGYTSLGQND